MLNFARFLILSTSLCFGTTAFAQQADAPQQSQPNSTFFKDLLEQLEEDKAKKEDADPRMTPTFDFPMPPIKGSMGNQPLGPGETMFLRREANGDVTNTLSQFFCPKTLDGAKMTLSELGNPTGAVMHCEYRSKKGMVILVMDGVGGRPIDLDAIVESAVRKTGDTPEIKTKTYAYGTETTDCRFDNGTDLNRGNLYMSACRYGPYVIKMLSVGTSPKSAKKSFNSVLKSQKKFYETRDRCAAHLAEIEQMQPSGATGRALMAESFEYQGTGPACFFTAGMDAAPKPAMNQVLYTLPDNPDTPVMMTFHKDDGRMEKVYYLQHAFARQEEKATQPAVYNLIKATPDGTIVVYAAAFSRVLPPPRFYREVIKAESGETKEKVVGFRREGGGFNMTMK